MKKILKASVSLIFTVVLITMSMLTAFAAHEDSGIYDYTDKLSEKQVETLDKAVQNSADYMKMNVCVLIVDDKFFDENYNGNDSDATVQSCADSFYNELYNSEQKNTDGILILMNFDEDNKYDYISTCGRGQYYFTNSQKNNRVSDILHAVEVDIDSDLNKSINTFVEQIKLYYDKGIPNNYSIIDEKGNKIYVNQNGETSNKPFFNLGKTLLISIGISAVVTLIVGLLIKSRYKFKAGISATAYVEDGNTVYRERNDTFIRTYTTKTHIESSSGGGGSSGSSHSSGGSSFGGGGSHR